MSQILNLKILIVEDDPTSEFIITRAVRAISRETLNLKSGIEAVEVCRNNSDIDLVLLDIQLPFMDGYEVARQIRKISTKIIIIAQTAFALTGDREKAIEAGCNDYISKPINNELLLTLIRKQFEPQSNIHTSNS